MSENRNPQDSIPFDPFSYWRQFYETSEQAWTKALKDVITTKDYAESQGKVLETVLAFQKVMRDSMSSQLNSFNLPTRDDVSRLGELIISLEEKIDQMDDRLAGLEEGVGGLEKKISSLGERPSGFEGHLGKLDEGVGAVEKKMTRVVSRLDDVEKQLAARTPVSREEEKAGETANGAAGKGKRAAVSESRPSETPDGAPSKKTE